MTQTSFGIRHSLFGIDSKSVRGRTLGRTPGPGGGKAMEPVGEQAPKPTIMTAGGAAGVMGHTPH